MAESITPKPGTATKLRAPHRLQSPTSPFCLGSNDDQFERAQVRAARAAANRRKSVVHQPSSDNSEFLDKKQITELFQNCIKLSSENKINQKNTWELNLIDHLSEIIKIEVEDDAETNFQKASCTLEAGIKIYSMRVDSVHSEAYKVLGGINRAGREVTVASGDQLDAVQEDRHSKQDSEMKMSPLSTLESSFEALNVKKFDVAFVVDPLYHHMSAQFDEGGANGLLLNNLGVYGGCRVLFDSLEMPGKCTLPTTETHMAEVIDISFARECVEQMMIHMPGLSYISPTLKDIVSQFDEDTRQPVDIVVDGSQNDNVFDNGPCCFDHDDSADYFGDCSAFNDDNFLIPHEENERFTQGEPDLEVAFENVANFMYLGSGFDSRQNAWAGPDHWKFRKVKGAESVLDVDNGLQISPKKSKTKRKTIPDLDFTKLLEKEMSDIFAPPKNPKSLLLPASRVRSSTILPEDCHYQPEHLVKLFILPDVMCLARSHKNYAVDLEYQNGGHDRLASWDDNVEFAGQLDEENVHSDGEESVTLISQPRKVTRIDVQYDRFAKQVDVHALKGALWHCMEELVSENDNGGQKMVSFCHLLSVFPVDCTAAASGDISPHLFFICLLHLANEHHLAIQDCSTMDELYIFFP